MVKAVVGDEIQLNLAEGRISRSGVTPQVGLVIGKVNPVLDRGFIYSLIPTPPNDVGDPPCSLSGPAEGDDKKKGPKYKSVPIDSSFLSIDSEWVAEHARQVSRMLIGGVKVIGIYIAVGDTVFKNSTSSFCQTLMSVSQASSVLDAKSSESLLLHLSFSPRRWTCRSIVSSSTISSSNLRPCDFKMNKVLNNLKPFKCNYDFELKFSVSNEGSSTMSTLRDVLRDGLSSHAKSLHAAKYLVDGKIVADTEPCPADGGSCDVEFLLPFTMSSAPIEAHKEKTVLGAVFLKGSVSSFSYASPKDPISQAVSDMKDDIITTLRSRLDIICEAEDDAAHDEQDINPLSKPLTKVALSSLREKISASFPRRVFIPWLPDVYICDYLQPSETLEAVKDHCVEFFSMEDPPDVSRIVEPETDAIVPVGCDFWAVSAPRNLVAAPPECVKDRNVNEGLNPLQYKFASAAVLFLVLAVVLGVLMARYPLIP